MMKVFNTYVKIRLWIHRVWLVICALIRSKFEKIPEVHHTFLIIGDGLAEGFGDSVSLAQNSGIANYLQEIDALELNRITKTYWRFVNCGHYAATSYDWSPTNDQKPSYNPSNVTDTLWIDTIHKHHDAKIALVCVGSNDKFNYGDISYTPDETLENIINIYNELSELGIHVILTTIPLRGSTVLDKRLKKARNKLIRKFAVENDIPLVELDMGKFRLKDLYYVDNLHFNSNGYKMFAVETYSHIANTMKKIEFEYYATIIH
eukprot:TRINITY_DN1110_c1_g1_i4.p1 TRINITY_DN1110_c1_g1~~TRINITY_DN1110_c1_g1_i4.p1  ORF type:complete len:262 (+),score=40.82 TRINITY_DN1110_c1_g1_i4:1-786(+)